MQALLHDDDKFSQFAGSFLSQAKHELDLLPAEMPYASKDVQAILAENKVMRLGGLRALYFSHSLAQGLCYIDGMEVSFACDVADAVKLLCDNVIVTPEQLSPWQNNEHFLTFITEQVNAGYWYFSE